MRRNVAIETRVPETDERNPAKQVSLVAQFSSIRQKLNVGSRETLQAMDKLAAPWIDEALSKHPNLKTLEDEYGCEKAYISQVRNGHVAAPMRFVLPLLNHPNCIDALTNAMRTDAGLPVAPRAASKVTREQLCELALMIFVESPGLLRTLIREAADRYGANEGEVAATIAGAAK